MKSSVGLLIFSLLVASAGARPNIAAEEPTLEKKIQPGLTEEQFDGYLNLLRMFKDMLPKDLMNTLDSLNGGEKGELIGLITNWFSGKIKKPANREEFAEMVKENLPTVAAKISQLNATFYEKFDKLQPKTQEMLRAWRDKAINLSGGSTGEAAAQQLQLMREFALSIQTLDSETKEDLRSQFPTAVRLTEGLGFTVITTMMMIVQKISETLTPVATMAPMMDCPVDK